MGKVLVQVEDAEGVLSHSGPPAPVAPGIPPAPAEPIMAPPVQAKTVFAARPDRSYLLIGGLGGLGLALATWLAQRGAKHLILSSKRCVYGYAPNRIHFLTVQAWQDRNSSAYGYLAASAVRVSRLQVVRFRAAKQLVVLVRSRVLHSRHLPAF